ncbi:hypothetical protein HZS_3780 [Henneguya salminicola]|nr:hypothetical protein HZS_3780 [Henneguya salminicola]
MIIFASRKNLNYLLQSKSIYFDAIFKTIPDPWTNHLTITVQCIYALMQRKTKPAYDTVWYSILRMINLNCNPAMCDFELALINYFNTQYPHCELTRFFFHLGQYLWRKIQEKCWSNLYVNDSLFQTNIKMFLYPAFCSSASALVCVETFNNYSKENGQIMEILKYFYRVTSQKYPTTTLMCYKYMQSI